MNTQIDINKVKEAVKKYGKSYQPPRRDSEDRTPQDAAIRKPLLGRGRSCSGFYCKSFLHGYE